MTVVTFTDFFPPLRADNVPWNRAQIQESAAADGPFNIIDTKNLVPLDTDPSNPAAREFTTTLATLDEGWYRIIFLDAGGNASSASEPIFNSPVVEQPYLPTITEVGTLERDRTVDQFGNELGTFNESTRPTGHQVQQLIYKAASDVTAYTGTDIPTEVWDDVRNLIALRAAMYVELSHFGEQVARGNSPYDDYKELYEGPDGMGGQKKQVVEQVEAAKTGDTPGPVSNYAHGSFPADAGGMVGWGTRW